MSDEGITAIATILSALAAAGSTGYGIYSATQGGGGGGMLPGTPAARPRPADLAAGGALRSELMGSVSQPQWKGGLTGNITPGPVPGVGSATSSDLGQKADEMSNILKSLNLQ